MTKHASKASRADELVKRCEELALSRADEARLAVHRVLKKCSDPADQPALVAARSDHVGVHPGMYVDDADQPLPVVEMKPATKVPSRADRFSAEVQRLSARTEDVREWSTNERWEAIVMFLMLHKKLPEALGTAGEMVDCVNGAKTAGGSGNMALIRAQANQRQWPKLLKVAEQACEQIEKRSREVQLEDVFSNLVGWQKPYYAMELFVAELQNPERYLPDRCWGIAYAALETTHEMFDTNWPAAYCKDTKLKERDRVYAMLSPAIDRLATRPRGETAEIQRALQTCSGLLRRMMRSLGWWTVKLEPAAVMQVGESPVWRRASWIAAATKRGKHAGYIELKAKQLRRLASRQKLRSSSAGRGKRLEYDLNSLIACPELLMYRADLQRAIERELAST